MATTQDEHILLSFGKKLRALREAKDWSQTKLGHEAEIEPQYVSRMERGKASPGLIVIVKLVRALGCNLDDLIEIK